MLLLSALLSLTALAGPATEVASRPGANIQRPSWSPDGRQISYEANFHDIKQIELYVGDPRQKAFRRVQPVVRGASSIATGFGGSGGSGGSGAKVAHELTWSPANVGRYVYTASNDANVYDLYMMNGGAVGASAAADGGAAWSPDGQHIAFTSARTGQGDLYLLTVASLTAPPKRLTRDEESAELFPTWSPDGQKLAFVGKGRNGDNLFLLPSLTSAPTPLTTWPGTQIAPSFSPDGSKIAFYANKDDRERFDLFVMDARAGALPPPVATDVVVNAAPRWTPDGRDLVFVCNDDAKFDPLCRVAAQAGAPVRVLDLGTVGHGDLDLVRGPDGGLWLAFVAQGRTIDQDRSFRRLFIGRIDG
jgi:Tol biopolymer transport system component